MTNRERLLFGANSKTDWQFRLRNPDFKTNFQCSS